MSVIYHRVNRGDTNSVTLISNRQNYGEIPFDLQKKKKKKETSPKSFSQRYITEMSILASESNTTKVGSSIRAV